MDEMNNRNLAPVQLGLSSSCHPGQCSTPGQESCWLKLKLLNENDFRLLRGNKQKEKKKKCNGKRVLINDVNNAIVKMIMEVK